MFDAKIKQFQNQMDDLDKEMPEQIEIRHAYRTRRFEIKGKSVNHQPLSGLISA